jgi:multisubunit Na+/H+ antiporter MnhE subunit
VPNSRENSSERGATRVGLWLSWWTVFTLFWMLLVGTLVAPEVAVGALAAAVAATVAEIVRVQDARRFRPRLRWLLRARRLPGLVVADSITVFAALWRHLRGVPAAGAFRAFRYPTRGESSRDAARRALLNAAISITPNTIVVGIDEESELILVHQLVPCERARTREEVIGRL